MTRTKKNWISDLKIYLEDIPSKVFNQPEFEIFFSNLKVEKVIPSQLSYDTFRTEIMKHNIIRKNIIKHVGKSKPKRTKFIRYIYKSPSPFSIGLSIRSKSCLTHATALFLHGLIENQTKTIYVNKEQSPKMNSNKLTQEALDRAFKNKARQSNYIWKWGNYRFILLNGKHNGNCGVIELELETGETLQITDLERTLIDIVVRPHYCGGIKNLIEIYTKAEGKVSVKKIIETLKQLDYIYPYHQSIGFLMERSGFKKRDYNQLKDIGLDFDFYLDYSIKNKKFDTNWKLYYPREI